ncbi:excinuclease ABC subunit UvrA [Peptoniphilus sp. KCTC 25270]|uniref:excinuclease ABC subunit UvrA n=1 Tax=Peptoniphilus sp. KCTC 25270 TaxID=2897414 RepID=UPI001E2A2BCF|nr:excinuclease ABC subunit UvrA [Peptoniphilus sp. KCTC 25270]MCD1146801.1 excinuclease ABC subunit UvrA [Peptoniphilus sp. KCTC 25270]
MNKKYDESIRIGGARQHNLKNIDVEIPRDAMTVITGLSGSGKSSLAFDTIYAEGQRRYVESLSSYARQFLGQMDKPDVDCIEGMSPAIAIDQKTTSKNPRSTVGTVTEIYDYIRLLYARIGRPHCPICGEEIAALSPDQIVDSILQLEEGTRMQVLSPIVKEKKGQHKKILENIKKEGFIRVQVDGELMDLDEEIELDKNKRHDISVVVDRLILREGIESRLTDSLETALKMSNGVVILDTMDGNQKMYSTSYMCPKHQYSIEEVSPRSFSFNTPMGACPTCNGLGASKQADPDLIIPNWNLSIDEGAVSCYSDSDGTFYKEILNTLAKEFDFSTDKPLKEAPKEFIDAMLNGYEKPLRFEFKSYFSGDKIYNRAFEGVLENINRRYRESSSDRAIERLEEYMSEIPCPTCKGARLKESSLAFKIQGLNIYETTLLSVLEAKKFFKGLVLTEKEKTIAEQVLKEIVERLSFLEEVGLGYLTLARMAGSLSGGESQRIRLATQIGSALVGVTYVLDEPSIGLHQKDNAMLLKALRSLTDIGNTLIVVEHDEDTMRQADNIIDIGPGAGLQGGQVIAEGSIKEIMANKNSVTGQYLSGSKKIEVPKERRKYTGKSIEVIGAQENNLKNIDVEFPLGQFVCVTGVSGSGKSSLVNQILLKSLAQQVNKSKIRPGKHKSIKGLEEIDKIVAIDQSPIGRTPRSNPATYTGTFDIIRDLFAATNEAKMRGYKKGRFSFNVKGGRCEACKGDGIIKVEMHFLPDVYVPCEVCKGDRYNRETLQVRYKGKNISDILNMTVDESVDFFKNHSRIINKIRTLQEVGLGYITLGQPSTQLSGGEAQRIKLATELSKRSTGKTMYILDEPTTGLHAADIHKLVMVLEQLVEKGNTVVVIEHNLDVIKMADHIIDLGPDGGDGGGQVVCTGRPEEIVKIKNSYTGQFLKPVLEK